MSNINNDITSMLVDIVNNNLSNGYKLLEDKVTINGFMSSLINKAIDTYYLIYFGLRKI